MKDKDDLIYQRLRDFHIPAAILDTIMAKNDMKSTLLKVWHDLREKGLLEDEIAESVARTIQKELDL
ncbi:MAG: hypothetical protein ACE5DO_08905 [Desulfobacterales bacterium]